MSVFDHKVFDSVAEGIRKIRSRADVLAADDDMESPRNVRSNSELLIKALSSFFADKGKATYLPNSIRKSVFQSLSEIDVMLNGIPQLTAEDPVPLAEPVRPVLLRLDQLYSLALQFGLISFGLKPKVIQEQLNEMQGQLANMSFLPTEMKGTAAKIQADIEKVSDEFRAFGEASRAKYESELQQKMSQVQPLVDLISVKAAEAERMVLTVGPLTAQIVDHSTELTKLQADTTRLSETVSAELQSLQTSSAAALRATQLAETQTNDSLAAAKAQLQAAVDARASIAVQLSEITEFYAEIEKHKSEMLRTQKDSISAASALREETEKRIGDLSTRTEAVVKTNEGLIDQIQDHLRKAVGVTLFTAFDKRRGHLFNNTVIWAVGLAVATAFGLAFAIWFVHSITQAKVEPTTMLARLVIATPIAFLITFTARQYSRERRAEEEYAFKSAVSVSLESYRELVEKMTKDNPDADTEFVKKLILEIFDNPANRLYQNTSNKEAPSEEVPDLLESVNKLADTLSKLVSKVPGAKT